ncbi:MAG: AAA family ATPase, partial [Planctomycetes bacterium]|nr:AAA family ATPase [Planctomycetota bacterium]
MATQSYVERTIAPVTRRVAREFPALVLTGPRQSGKTTLLKHVFGKSHRYVSIEPPDVRIAAVENPRAFLDFNPAPVIFDEIQYAPELLAYIKERIDASRATPGQYLLTGSQNLALVEGVSESLAGRAAVLELLPLSQRETASAPNRSLPWERKRTAQTPPERPLSYRRLWESLLRGNFPELVAHPKRDGRLWHASYVQTYLERDVRSLRQVGDLTQFQNFLRALAARSTQLLNLADLARDLGIALNTVKAWLSVLEASFQVIILRPY